MLRIKIEENKLHVMKGDECLSVFPTSKTGYFEAYEYMKDVRFVESILAA